MANFSRRGASYSALNNEETPPLGHLRDSINAAPTIITLDQDNEDSNVVIHKVPQTKGGWTHIEDLDSFFTRMYRYYLRGGFYPMIISDCFYLLQLVFIMWFSTFLIHCVNYPKLFRDDPAANRSVKLTLHDVIYPSGVCVARISWMWWCVIALCSVIWTMRLFISIYHLYYAYDTKLFYNHALKINDNDLPWVNWSTIQDRVREAQLEHHMCVHKREINELDIYHRILRFNNYMVAMVNKNLLPLQVRVPLLGDFHYLSKGLKYNLEFLLFSSPWSPWENCWQLRDCYKEQSKRMALAKQLERQIMMLAIVNLLLAPLIQAWQMLYFFFNYAELIKRSPASLGLRTWSLFARITLRHFNELDHELRDRLTRAHKPSAKYLASFSSPIMSVFAKNVAFISASVVGVLVALSVYDEDVLTVEHVLSIITVCGCVLAGARALIGTPEQGTVAGTARGEELLVQVLGHVHYLPAGWLPRAHTRDVAAHFRQLFQFRAVYILFELLSPVLCPLVLFSLKSRALDIVDFYRNFTVRVLGIGDVCSFAQLDIRKHGNPDWQTVGKMPKLSLPQYSQGEGGKTELSLIAFSCRHPGWAPPAPQRAFLQSVRRSLHQQLAPHTQQNKTMLGSFLQQSIFGANTPMPAVLSFYQQRQQPFRLPDMDESDGDGAYDKSTNEEGSMGASAMGLAPLLPPLPEGEADDVREMSASTLHLYDLKRQPGAESSCCPDQCATRSQPERWESGEHTPLLRP
ncbi:autophagy-related protein 9A [Plutella xylostella]|uniref:autophagy-related protein 9A n=1 Tax=Plutella xylostella TaxID=51655 RepID=UPI002032D89F|nr:autophagy-related protein 9A [Plutella xylostella]